MIRLTPTQEDALVTLTRLAGDEDTWALTGEIVSRRLQNKGLDEPVGGCRRGGYHQSTLVALKQLNKIVPRLVDHDEDFTAWKLTVAGKNVAGVQLGLFKKPKGGAHGRGRAPQSGGSRPGRNTVA